MSRRVVERCGTLRETSEQSDFASDKQMLRSHEAHGDPHDRIGCDLSHYVPPLRRNTAGLGRNPAQIAQTAAAMSTFGRSDQLLAVSLTAGTARRSDRP